MEISQLYIHFWTEGTITKSPDFDVGGIDFSWCEPSYWKSEKILDKYFTQ